MYEIDEKFYFPVDSLFFVWFLILFFIILFNFKKIILKLRPFLLNDILMFFVSLILFLVWFFLHAFLDDSILYYLFYIDIPYYLFYINSFFLILSLFLFSKILYKFLNKKIWNFDKNFWKIQWYQFGITIFFLIIIYFLKNNSLLYQIFFLILFWIIFFILPNISFFYKKNLYSILNIIFTLLLCWFVIIWVSIIDSTLWPSGAGLLIELLLIYPVIIVPILFLIKFLYNFFKKSKNNQWNLPLEK